MARDATRWKVAVEVPEAEPVSLAQAPSQLKALLRRTVTGRPVSYKNYPGTEAPHIFRYPCNTRFSTNMAGLRILLRTGLMRVQVNEINFIDLYFAET